VDGPEWWEWPLELTPHVIKRMRERGFSETDLRAMMDDAIGCAPDEVPGRWAVRTRLHSQEWQVIVEPDREDELLVVVTAFEVAS
jgi:hypothetical protein